MKDWFLKVWKDPVWSKVISAAIIGLAVYISSIIENIPLTEKIIQIYDIKVRLVYVVLFLFLVSILYSLYKRYTNSKKVIIPSVEIRKFNKLTYPNMDLMARWVVGINTVPFTKKLEIYCTKHDPPMRLMYDNCPVPNCQNGSINIDEEWFENNIESRLRQAWDDLNSD